MLEGRPDPVAAVAALRPVHDVHAEEADAGPHAERLAGLAPCRRHRDPTLNRVVAPGLAARAGVDDLPRCLDRDRAWRAHLWALVFRFLREALGDA